MKWAMIAAAAAFAFLGNLPDATAQPVLERLEQRIRSRIGQKADGVEKKSDQQKAAEQKPAQPGYVGIVGDDKADRGRGVRVLDVRCGGPAERAGIRKQDLITSLAGIRVRQMTDMSDILELFPAGDTVEFEVLRDRQRQKVKVVLGERPASKPKPDMPAAKTPARPVPHKAKRPPQPQSKIDQLQQRIEQLERRVQELEQALAELRKKK